MATIHQQKLARSSIVAVGDTALFRWSPGNWNTPLHFWVQPVPVAAVGPHGSNRAAMEIVRMETVAKTDNDDGDERYADLWVKNTGNVPASFDVYMSWIT